MRHYHQKEQSHIYPLADNENDPSITKPPDAITEAFIRHLAKLHFELEPSIEKIIWVKSGTEKEIRLIEVNRTAFPSDSIEVFRFAPSEDVPFPLFIADITPREWQLLQEGDLPLPEGWKLESTEVYTR